VLHVTVFIYEIYSAYYFFDHNMHSVSTFQFQKRVRKENLHGKARKEQSDHFSCDDILHALARKEQGLCIRERNERKSEGIRLIVDVVVVVLLVIFMMARMSKRYQRLC